MFVRELLCHERAQRATVANTLPSARIPLFSSGILALDLICEQRQKKKKKKKEKEEGRSQSQPIITANNQLQSTISYSQ
jgi:hypothetical protein